MCSVTDTRANWNEKKVKIQNCICVCIFLRVREIANSICEKSKVGNIGFYFKQLHSYEYHAGFRQDTNARKVNCNCVYSVYILKPVLSGLCSHKFPMTTIFHIIFVKIDSMSGLCLLFRPKRVHCSTKDAYTSEITFLALVPWVSISLKAVPDQECVRYQSFSLKMYSIQFGFFIRQLVLFCFGKRPQNLSESNVFHDIF